MIPIIDQCGCDVVVFEFPAMMGRLQVCLVARLSMLAEASLPMLLGSCYSTADTTSMSVDTLAVARGRCELVKDEEKYL